ncbi:MAG: signal peptidase I [Planctomycetes bacterium]|nr:signal peptidase I [Planctomycetota bacterium]
MNLLTLAQDSDGGGGAIFVLVELAILVFFIVTFWKIFGKAGQPGWYSLIPIFNIYILLKIVGRPWWWLILCMIPFVGIIIAIIVTLDLAKSFGKGVGFAIGMILLGIVFYPILAFGSAEYQGPAAA